MDISDSSANKKRYQKAFASHGESPKSLKWVSYKSAAIRYRELVADISVEGKTILDVGCGMGDLLPYLYAKSTNFEYLGLDIIPEFINIAKKRYYNHEFRLSDPFNKDFNEKFSIVIASGVMNHSNPDWLDERKKMITKLYDLAKETVVFNMAGSFKSAYTSTNVTYANAQQILDFCLSLTTKIILRSHYHPKDFTVIVFK